MPTLAKKRFTQHTVASLTCPTGKRYVELRDAGLRGLSLRANAGGSKSFYVQLDRNTKRIIGDAHLLTLTAARTKATEMLVAHQSGETPESRRNKQLTLGEFLLGPYTEWFSKHSPKYGERDNLRLVRALGPLARKRMDQVSQFGIEKWKASRQVKPATINRELAQLKASFNRAIEWSFVTSNPAQSVRLLKDKSGKRVRYLSDTERQRLDAALDKRHDHLPYIVRLVLMTGLRRGEIFSLRWEDINLKSQMLIVQASNAKSDKGRHIPLNTRANALLKAWQMKSGNRSGLVFPNPSTGLQLGEIKTGWRTLMRNTAINEFRFHDLRHDFASQLVMHGVDLYRVKELLGHGSIAMTERYAHLAPEALAEAVEVLV